MSALQGLAAQQVTLDARAAHAVATTMSTMMNWNDCPDVERVPDRLGGEWVFKDTRVPVRALFENLEAGACLDDFLEWFPGVTREQALGVLRFAERSLASTR